MWFVPESSLFIPMDIYHLGMSVSLEKDYLPHYKCKFHGTDANYMMYILPVSRIMWLVPECSLFLLTDVYHLGMSVSLQRDQLPHYKCKLHGAANILWEATCHWNHTMHTNTIYWVTTRTDHLLKLTISSNPLFHKDYCLVRSCSLESYYVSW